MSIYDISRISRNGYLKDIIEACEKEINLSHENFLSIENCIMTLADNTNIEDWEKWFELSKHADWTLEDRINRLVYTFNSRGFFTPKFLKEQAMTFTNGEIDIIEDFPNYHFTIKFINIIGTPPNLENFKDMVDINKPVHLTYEIQISYRIWGDLKEYTWDTLKVDTWEELKTGGIV